MNIVTLKTRINDKSQINYITQCIVDAFGNAPFRSGLSLSNMCAEELSKVDVSAAVPNEEGLFLIFFLNDK